VAGMRPCRNVILAMIGIAPKGTTLRLVRGRVAKGTSVEQVLAAAAKIRTRSFEAALIHRADHGWVTSRNRSLACQSCD